VSVAWSRAIRLGSDEEPTAPAFIAIGGGVKRVVQVTVVLLR
jgi:hypothetical protein